jgi:hypothetical protein
MRKPLRLAIVSVLAIVTAVLGTQGSAAAAETAYNSKRQYLSADPVDSDPPSCKERSIYLARGTYEWRQFVGSHTGVGTNLSLEAGTYSWRDCLYPIDSSDGTWDYRQQSELYRPGIPGFYLDGRWGLVTSTEYTWGSYLDPAF